VNLVSGIAIVVGSEINWDIISNVIEEPTDGNIYKGTLAGGQNGLYNYAGSTTPLVGDFDISIEARQQTLNTGGGYWRFGVDFSDSLTYVSAGVFSFDYGLQGINATGNIASFRRVGGASGTIQTLPYNTGDVLRIVRSGTTIMLYFNTNLLATFTGVSTANMYPYMAMATNTFIWNPIKS
jgi:hypothetical protein